MKEIYNNIIIYQNTNSEKRKVEKVHSKYFGNRQVNLRLIKRNHD